MEDNNLFDILSLSLNFVSFIVLSFIAFLTLKFTAKPKLQIKMEDVEKIRGTYWLLPGKKIEQRFSLNNVGHIYASPAIINAKFYINYDPEFEMFNARFGSSLELESSEVRRGKDNSKYITVSGMNLYHSEPAEQVTIEIRTPIKPGVYKCWISAKMNETDLGVHKFKLKIL